MVSRTQNRGRQATLLSQAESDPDLAHQEPIAVLQQLSIRVDRLLTTDEISAGRACELVERIAQLGRPASANLLGEYLFGDARLDELESQQIWNTVTGYLDRLVCGYRWCLEKYEASAGMAKATASVLAAVATHAIQACGARQKWAYLRCHRATGEQWAVLLGIYVLAERAVRAREEPARQGMATERSTAENELIKALALAASSPGGLAPSQIELVERLVERCAPQLALAQSPPEPGDYFVDLSAPDAPQHLFLPQQLPDSSRIIVLSRALQTLQQLGDDLDNGLLSVADLGLDVDKRCDPELVGPALRHLLRCWRKAVRRDPRHREISRVAVVHDFAEVASKVLGNATEGPIASGPEHWIVENRSESGLLATVSPGQGHSVGAGSLIAFRYPKRSAWQAGIVRRVEWEDEETRRLAIERLIPGTSAVTIRPRFRRTAEEQGKTIVGMHLVESPASADHISLLLPAGTFSPSAPLEMRIGGRGYLLIPQRLVESGQDYQIARFKLLKPVQ